MNLEFTQQEIDQLNEMIHTTPFKYAYPIFLFFQKKFNNAQKATAQLQTINDGDKDTGQ